MSVETSNCLRFPRMPYFLAFFLVIAVPSHGGATQDSVKVVSDKRQTAVVAGSDGAASSDGFYIPRPAIPSPPLADVFEPRPAGFFSYDGKKRPVSEREIDITVGVKGNNTKFRVPVSYLTFLPERKGGHLNSFSVEVLLPDMRPAYPVLKEYRRKIDPELGKFLYKNKIFIVVKSGWNYTTRKTQGHMVLPARVRPNFPVEYGLMSLGRIENTLISPDHPKYNVYKILGRIFREQDGIITEFGIDRADYYVPFKRNDHKGQYFYCLFPEIVRNANCRLNMDLNSSLMVRVVFSRPDMAYWQDIKSTVEKFVQSLIVE